jgi:hypothetical protein
MNEAFVPVSGPFGTPVIWSNSLTGQIKLTILDGLADEITFDAPPVPSPLPTSGWINTDGLDCRDVCNSFGKINVASPEGMFCASGENRPALSGQSIVYKHGTFGSDDSIADAMSDGKYCYKTEQKKDGDGTDITVACYCK